jgi:hypothetical protein
MTPSLSELYALPPFLSDLYAHLRLPPAAELFAAELLEQLDATEASRRNGHLSAEVMTLATIKHLASAALLAAHAGNYRPSGSLIILIARLLGVSEQRRDKMKNPEAWLAAFKEKVRNPSAGVRQLARAAGVPASTVTRWQREQAWRQVFPEG